jgi:hypothetical protein
MRDDAADTTRWDDSTRMHDFCPFNLLRRGVVEEGMWTVDK